MATGCNALCSVGVVGVGLSRSAVRRLIARACGLVAVRDAGLADRMGRLCSVASAKDGAAEGVAEAQGEQSAVQEDVTLQAWPGSVCETLEECHAREVCCCLHCPYYTY